MRISKAQIRADIQVLLSELEPFRLNNAEQIAALLRDESADDPNFPSGGYVRLMLSKADKPDPSERFADRFYKLKNWVEQQLGNGATELAILGGKLIIREDTYDPATKLTFVTTPGRLLELREVVVIENAGSLIGGFVYLPPEWLGQCWADGCGRFFLRRSTRARYCSKGCRQAEANRRRRERKRQNAAAPNQPPQE